MSALAQEATTKSFSNLPVTENSVGKCDRHFKAPINQTNLRALVKRKDISAPKKDEYETLGSYQKRIIEHSAKVKSILAADFGAPMIVLMLEIPQGTMKYDPEKASFAIGTIHYNPDNGKRTRAFYLGYGGYDREFAYSGIAEASDFKLVTIPQLRTTTDLGSYVAENRFGVKRNVARRKVSEIGVYFRRDSLPDLLNSVESLQWISSMLDEKRAPSERSTPILLKMPANQAKQDRDKLAILLVGELVAPFIANGQGGRSPTIDSPTEIIASLEAITARIDCAAIVNRATREILYRLKS